MVGVEVEVEQVRGEGSLAVGDLAGEEDERAPTTATTERTNERTRPLRVCPFCCCVCFTF